MKIDFLIGCLLAQIFWFILIIFVFPRFFTRVAVYFYDLGQKSFIKTASAYRAFTATVSYYFGAHGKFYLFLASLPSKLMKISSKKTADNKHKAGNESTNNKSKKHKNTISKTKINVKKGL
jgi:hypothetical protein